MNNEEGDLYIPPLEKKKEENGEEEEIFDVDVDVIWNTKDRPNLYAIADADGEIRPGLVVEPMDDWSYDPLDYGNDNWDDAIEFDD